MSKLSTIGISVIVAGFLPLIAEDIYKPTKEYLVKHIPSLSSDPIMITFISALIGIIIGSVLITNDRYKWIQKLSNTQTKQSVTYNAKKLNDEVFRKLMRVEIFESFELFEEKVGFGIPKDPVAFSNKASGDYKMWFLKSRKSVAHETFYSITFAISKLETGERYLEIHYPNIYKNWNEIKTELHKLNQDRIDFFNSVSDKIVKELKEYFGTYPLRILSSFDKKEWNYYNENMSKVIFLQSKAVMIHFKKENHDNMNFLIYPPFKVLGCFGDEKFNISYFEEVFQRQISSEKFTDKEREFYLRFIELDKKVEFFCNELENKVVNDIDSMI